MDTQAYFITARELFARGKQHIPDELVSSKHLIYSSPAALAFNSPGAQGYGVKRAGLAVPGSVMLLVSPGCCGRNTTILGDEGGYGERIFYLEMEETDIVTGRHLAKIPAAVEEICSTLDKKPSVVMICITCVDALLGTDMERVCRKVEAETGIPARACYMYALTREGIRPPMAAVREAVYSLLEPARKDPRAANLLGFFSPLEEGSELYAMLAKAGLEHIREIGSCKTFEDYKRMSEANFNLVLNQEARFAADDLSKKLAIPYIEITRFYQTDKMANQYRLLGGALGVRLDYAAAQKEADDCVADFRARHGALSFSVGESLNADPFELSLALVRYGFKVPEIFGTVTPQEFPYLRQLAELSPGTRIYSNLSPTMLCYDGTKSPADVTLGRDAAYYHPSAAGVSWNGERQPYGFKGLVSLFNEISQALAERSAA
jgi:nitrogenase molybdenum-cofactor synthesis protein NifE